MHSSKSKASNALKHLARNKEIKDYVLNNEDLYSILLKGARRFIAGTNIAQCIDMARQFNEKSVATTIDFMGEDTVDKEQAMQAYKKFRKVISVINEYNLQSSVSLDLSHIGLSVEKKLAIENLKNLANEAQSYSIEIMISMEGSEKTDNIFSIYEEASKNYRNVGITIQAYLNRSADDLERLLKLNGKIRLVKGAFEEPADIAQKRGSKLNEHYLELLNRILFFGKACSIATHDQKLINQATGLISSYNVTNKAEFEMLLGVCNNNLKDLNEQGFNARVYLPFGSEWYLYYCHRLAENPSNVYQAIADMVK